VGCERDRKIVVLTYVFLSFLLLLIQFIPSNRCVVASGRWTFILNSIITIHTSIHTYNSCNPKPKAKMLYPNALTAIIVCVAFAIISGVAVSLRTYAHRVLLGNPLRADDWFIVAGQVG
jgi:hypothetical protein